mmetsp:Transcript_26525/g.84088  ORF Transcript_26525/g.84088 Transcript_26525/m.84088 type:complete len:213 (-) Transcript_26525:28-666(-)
MRARTMARFRAGATSGALLVTASSHASRHSAWLRCPPARGVSTRTKPVTLALRTAGPHPGARAATTWPTAGLTTAPWTSTRSVRCSRPERSPAGRASSRQAHAVQRAPAAHVGARGSAGACRSRPTLPRWTRRSSDPCPPAPRLPHSLPGPWRRRGGGASGWRRRSSLSAELRPPLHVHPVRMTWRRGWRRRSSGGATCRRRCPRPGVRSCR